MDTRSLPHTIEVAVDDLSIGMYVARLDRPWTETPFLFQGFLIREQQELRLLKEHCQSVWVDAKQSISGVKQLGQADDLAARRAAIAKVNFDNRMKQAQPIWDAARESSLRILNAVKFGQTLDVATVKEVVKECVDHILESPSAMLWLARIKDSDEYTAEHCLRVGILSIALGRELGLMPLELEQVGICGMLHDVGKLKVPDEILNKPGRLTEEEFKIMQLHSIEGRKLLLANGQVPAAAVDVAYAHHERMDGGGYPRGLKANQIPYFAKIIAVVDAYDAINSDRVYSKGRSTMEALRILFDEVNTQFDEEVVLAFIRMVGIFPPGEIVELTNGQVAIITACSPDHKLKPRLLMVLDSDKKPCKPKVIDLMRNPTDPSGQPYRVGEVHPTGAFGIDIEAYRREGLIIPGHL
ncbi:HD-GYP domain-containing protein [Pseudomonas benzenivorans]|uniref:HD-GYP domain-containing protein n=1 Tax=Pseudomonas benzenivorans TaxID=556533 RepID=A0ABY5H6W8_9PSED|nr:HD-GYP domain-containing protein [Pseudomonas benzenivorans]UTW07868.1 HD-GYP domain-containing protein [Pseudomonas benzenivorans]